MYNSSVFIQTTFGKKSTNIYNIEETDLFLRFEKIIEWWNKL